MFNVINFPDNENLTIVIEHHVSALTQAALPTMFKHSVQIKTAQR